MDGALTSYSSQDPAGAKASPVPPCIQALNHDTTQVGGRRYCNHGQACSLPSPAVHHGLSHNATREAEVGVFGRVCVQSCQAWTLLAAPSPWLCHAALAA